MRFFGYLLPCLILLLAAIYSIFAKNMIRAAVSLGIGSVALALLFFMLDSPFAGGFELSVGAGLTSILMIVVISLTKNPHGREEK